MESRRNAASVHKSREVSCSLLIVVTIYIYADQVAQAIQRLHIKITPHGNTQTSKIIDSKSLSTQWCMFSLTRIIQA